MTSFLSSKPTVVTEVCRWVEHKALSVSLLVVFILFHKQLQSIHLLHLLSTSDDHGTLLHPLNVCVGAVATHTAVEGLVCKLVETVSPPRKTDGPFFLGRLSIRLRTQTHEIWASSPGKGLAAPMANIGNLFLPSKMHSACSSHKPPGGTFCLFQTWRENLRFLSFFSVQSFCNFLFHSQCKETMCECTTLLLFRCSLEFYSNSLLKSQFPLWDFSLPECSSHCSGQ